MPGVPGLFPFIVSHFEDPQYLKAFDDDGETKATADNLYIDANSIIHNEAGDVFNYGEKRKRSTRSRG